MEHRHLKITGSLLHPVDQKIETVELWFLPSDDLDEEKRKEHTPKAVGSLSIYDGRLNGLLSIPRDSLTPILQMLIADRFKFVDMGGTKLATAKRTCGRFGSKLTSTRTTCRQLTQRHEP